jgi:hypothetical protein
VKHENAGNIKQSREIRALAGGRFSLLMVCLGVEASQRQAGQLQVGGGKRLLKLIETTITGECFTSGDIIDRMSKINSQLISGHTKAQFP